MSRREILKGHGALAAAAAPTVALAPMMSSQVVIKTSRRVTPTKSEKRVVITYPESDAWRWTPSPDSLPRPGELTWTEIRARSGEGAIGKILGCLAKATTSKCIWRLVEHGYLTWRWHPRDSGKRLFWLTRDGEALRRSIAESLSNVGASRA